MKVTPNTVDPFIQSLQPVPNMQRFTDSSTSGVAVCCQLTLFCTDSQESEVPVGYDPGRVITEENGVDSCLNPKSSLSWPLEDLEVKL